MENLFIPEINDIYISPKVNFDAHSGLCEIEGESFLDETATFYGRLVDWLTNYFRTGKPIVFNLKLIYFNTSTSKWLLKMLLQLKNYKNSGHDVVVNWYVDSGDIDMIEDVKDFIDDLDFGINIVKYDVKDDGKDDDNGNNDTKES